MSDFQLNKEEFQKIIDSFKACAKDGRITEEQFRSVLDNVVGDRAKELNLENWWKFFEMHSDDKTADYIEVVMGLAVYYNGSLVDSLLLQFKMMDEDSSGTIELEEMKKFFRRIFEIQARVGGYPFEESRWKNVLPFLERSFKSADTDGSGSIDFKEFTERVTKDPDHPFSMLIMSVLSPKSIKPQPIKK